jgi:hypothetical protein
MERTPTHSQAPTQETLGIKNQFPDLIEMSRLADLNEKLLDPDSQQEARDLRLQIAQFPPQVLELQQEAAKAKKNTILAEQSYGPGDDTALNYKRQADAAERQLDILWGELYPPESKP